MKIIAIISEYNPFHNGHAYQISEVKKLFDDAKIISVMSGSFTQRGTPSLLDKWTKARLAISGGCDLVLELPFTSAVRSAQDFARGAIRLISKLGIVDAISFGAETSDLNKLQDAAAVFDAKNFPAQIKAEMSKGISYAAAVTKILSDTTNIDENILRQPNNILALEYLRALPKNIQPILIPRVGAGYNDLTLDEKFSSATAIRQAVYEKNPSWENISKSINKKVLAELQAAKFNGLPDEKFLLRPILTKIFTTSPENLRGIYGMREGLEYRLINAAKSAKTFDEFVNSITGKRYPISRVKRLLLHLLMNLTEEKICELQDADFVRVLAFNDVGKTLLKKIRATSSLPIVTKVTKHLNERQLFDENILPYKKNLSLDILSTDLRGILFDVPHIPRRDFTESTFSYKRAVTYGLCEENILF
ncbi:MAG: nucleotidyltransferase [Selenomonadaceae bacterium]|nr:nucleotidyltransferase [Selenomonadaceae bacterium]